MKFRLQAASSMLPLALFACTPAEEGAAEAEVEAADGEATPDPEASASDTSDEADAPDAPRPMMEHSAWRITGEDGATYATYLDSEGRYRDTKNGEPRQEGTWEMRDDGALCFLPDGDNAQGDCWDIGRADDDGAAEATGQNGKKIELQKIEYQPPEEE